MWGIRFRRGRSERSLIGDGMVVRGPIQSRGDLEIQGQVDGDIDHMGRLVIGGEVHGNVRVTDQLELLPTARLIGDVMCMRLVVHSGAIFQGSTRMPECPDVLPEPPERPAALPAGVSQPAQDSPLAILFQPIGGEERQAPVSAAHADEAPATDRKAAEAPAFYGGFQPSPSQK